MPQPRVLCLTPVPPRVAERARREFGAIPAPDHPMTVVEVADVLRKTPSIEGILLTNDFHASAEAIAAMPPTVKVLASISVGYDHIDLAAAKAHGLIVTNTPEVVTGATADIALLLMLGACRRAREYAAIINSGWPRRLRLDEMLGTDFTGKTLGIYGFGRIGQAVAKRVRGFDVKVLYHSRRRCPAALEQDATYYENFHDMLPHCQILSLHAPGGAGTENVIDRKAIALLPKGAIVINTARGSLIDEDALIEALKSGHLAAAGLDVVRNEPKYDPRFRDLQNVFMMPHMGSATVETRDAMGMRALDNLAAVLSGKPPLHPVV